MDYISNTDNDRALMLKDIGVQDVMDLFKDIPDSLILRNPLRIPDQLSEFELLRELENISKKNRRHVSFLGGGNYNHYIPSTVNAVTSRGEFSTAYTPYQPEISQGTLQAIFEYQSMICELTGMDVSNASMYDGATGLAESMILSTRIKGKKQVLVSHALNPLYREVLETYARASEIRIVEVDIKDGLTSDFKTDGSAAIIIQNPNFFGLIENLDGIRKKAEDILLITSTTEPLSWAILKPFSEYDVDIVTAEGQSFGNPMNFGGPGLGIIAVKQDYVRQIPGRLAGETVDIHGKRGFALTLCTREQHIRREKATSNICTNEGLCMLAASVYLVTYGKNLGKLARLNNQLAIYFADKLNQIEGVDLVFDKPFFNEFVVRIRKDIQSKISHIEIGISLEKYYPDLENCYLVCCTEMTPKEYIDRVLDEITQ
ncbi:glycine dehydrogenase subunit 1 [Candidatus Scalindua japonica]|uniref:glycine dehydrogenase (aminomethyl-transferring) n=1 Tax=Candidatus Scalindua japonica TaxID=1284222 RepID=A0A286TXG4_9BACT|nr:aminomethyl-transferring glycine dehydrogenase subunit GcvPA [Candidatus Scalindua japonica]GAX60572.1 glycine dehydrogenase subunit 1 [Candidatus Scalindua japonica]